MLPAGDAAATAATAATATARPRGEKQLVKSDTVFWADGGGGVRAGSSFQLGRSNFYALYYRSRVTTCMKPCKGPTFHWNPSKSVINSAKRQKARNNDSPRAAAVHTPDEAASPPPPPAANKSRVRKRHKYCCWSLNVD